MLTGTGFVVGMVAKIAVISACGIGATAFMNFVNKYEPKQKRKKGVRDEHVDIESLREKARAIR